MMDRTVSRRVVADLRAVCRSASPADAAKWVAGLMINLPNCARARSLQFADQAWTRSGARFQTADGISISLPAAYTAGAREMYCRNVYLQAGLSMPTDGWVVDLGANRGLFSVWAALSGAQVVAVEAQQGFIPMIEFLASHNGVASRVQPHLGLASGMTLSGARCGVVGDDERWAATSHGAPSRPGDVSVAQLLATYAIDNIRLLKVDIEGGEFGVFSANEDLSWLRHVDQIAMELHPDHGNAADLINRICSCGFGADLRDNDDSPVTAASARLTYAYFRRIGSRKPDGAEAR